MYFNVAYSVDTEKTIYSANIAIADSEEDVERFYSMENPGSEIIISVCNEYEIEAAKRKGMPIVKVK